MEIEEHGNQRRTSAKRRRLAVGLAIAAFAFPLMRMSPAEAKRHKPTTTTTVAPTTTTVAPTTTTVAPTTSTVAPTTTTVAPTTTTVPPTTSTTVVPPAVGYPTTPPAQVCGNTSLLNGPSSPPAGAVAVYPNDGYTLQDHTAYHPAGTTFWLAPGVHKLRVGDVYGQVVPKDGNTYVGAPGAVFDGQDTQYTAFGGHATRVTIKHLTVRNFASGLDQGVVNHDSGNDWVIERNSLVFNRGAALMIGARNQIRYNCLADNGQYGFNAYQAGNGIVDVVMDRNEIARNNTEDWEARTPCGCTGGGKFWSVERAQVTNNWVHDNNGTGIWADYDNVQFLFEGNLIENNAGPGIWYEISYNFMIRYNNIRGNNWRTDGGENFPFGGIYIAESGGDTRAGSVYAVSEIHGNLIANNWDGVVLWEDADRFCQSPAGGVSATCPFFDGTYGARNNTQNIRVHRNTFTVDKAAIGCQTATCGRNGLFSKWGSFSPWTQWSVAERITFQNNNRFHDNTYVGPWTFTIYDDGPPDTWAVWRGSPYSQDSGSTFNGGGGTVTTTTTVPPPTGTNLALNKPVTMSSGPFNGTTAAQVTNGNTATTDWMDLGPGPQWVQVDLGQSRSISTVNVRHYHGDGRTYRDVIIQVSNDPTFGSGVVTVFNNDSDNSAGQGSGTSAEYAEAPAGKTVRFTPLTARYVRAWVNGSSANPSGHFVEVEAYA